MIFTGCKCPGRKEGKLMVNETIKTVEGMMQALLAGEQAYFLVEVRIKPTNNVKVYLDGDQGISIEKCVQYNRALYKKLEESGLFPSDDFSLEVSSPGLDEPLKLLRQYKKNTGRQVEVVLQDGSRKEGRLLEVSEDGIIVEETKGRNKKKEVISHTFLFENIKTTKIQVVF
jgi:ribosome maturation factor RimP